MPTLSKERPSLRHSTAHRGVRVLVVVEGPHDIEFLRRISHVARSRDHLLPDLAALEQRGELIFIPVGGGGIAGWADRLAPLGLCEFHLFDRELPPETELRQAIAERINRRDGCHAVLTNKRSIENYLHPSALQRASGLSIEIGDFDPLAECVAKAAFTRSQPLLPWESLPRRAQRRLANRAKRWLNTRAVDQMTPERLAARDPDGEIASWLRTIAQMVISGAALRTIA